MYRVLIVDDEKIVRIALKSIIPWEENGFTIVGAAGDGMSALSMVEDSYPDIIITDLKMPKLDGIGLIKKLKENGYKGRIIVLSNYGEFELVREAMKYGACDYLLKLTLKSEELLELLMKITEDIKAERSQNELEQLEKIEIRESRQVLKSQFFRELLSDGIADLGSIKRKGEKLNVKLEESSFFMLYILIDNLNGNLFTAKINDRKLLTASVSNIVSEILSIKSGVEVIETGIDTFLAIIPCDDGEDFREKAYQAGINISRSILTYLNITVSIVVGGQFKGLQEMKKIYDACVASAEVRFYKGYGSIIGMDSHVNKMDNPCLMELAAITASEIKRFLEVGGLAMANAEIEKILTYAEKEMVEPNELKRLIRFVIEDLDKQLIEWRLKSSLPRIRFEEELLKSQTIEKVRAIVHECLQDLKLMVDEAKNEKFRKEICLIKDYIVRHYDEKINLEMIAKQVNMNKSYLCRMFKKETGKTLVNYLNDIRMQKAYELLKQPGSTVKEVSAAVGISDQFYFYRVFTKYSGVNPTEFKKQCKLSGKESQ